jgi:hypothetical protein
MTRLVRVLEPWRALLSRASLVVLPIAFATACAQTTAPAASGAPAIERVEGGYVESGGGRLSTYADMEALGAPKTIGVSFSSAFMNALPATHSDEHHCADRNKDGVVSRPAECFMGHEWVVPLPSNASSRADVPFKWALVNWNPMGHIPPGVYDLPHFDVHFYMEPIEKVFAIEPGPCGPEFVRCDQFAIAKKPVPNNYIHADYKDVDAVAAAMGNHLIDITAPEFNGQRFTRSWIFGMYDGRITFYEEMLSRDYLLSKPDTCHPIKTPGAVGQAGYYPTMSCIRYDATRDAYTVSMENFVQRERGEPGPLAMLTPPPPPSPPPAAR